jgi:DNA ligase-associated metallophosphoesterase
MKAPLSFTIAGQQIWLSPLRAIFWEKPKVLIVSDLHFGKTGHFRKAGIAVPQYIYRNDLQRLFDLIQYFKPVKIIMAGDFFHSSANKEAELFGKWRQDHQHISIQLVMGNHDILSEDWYLSNCIEVHKEVYNEGPFSFVHEWSADLDTETDTYYFSGHIHPGVRLNGAGRQSLRLPCFYFDKKNAILPAFSEFTGLSMLEPSAVSRVFVIANQQILSLK